MFHTANPKDIIEGKITDVYFERTIKVLKAKGINPVVKAEFIAKSLPENWPWAIFAGLEEAMYLMKHLPSRVRAIEEGTVFYPYEPVMEIEGRYQDFCVYETAILGLICQASGVATKAARFKKLAGENLVTSFGARRMHPILAPMIERNAYIKEPHHRDTTYLKNIEKAVQRASELTRPNRGVCARRQVRSPNHRPQSGARQNGRHVRKV